VPEFPTSVVDALGEAHPVLGYFSCLNDEDWDRMATLWDVDARMRAVGARPRRGRDDVLGYFTRLFEPWTTHVDLPTRVVVDGDVVVAEVTFTGRSRAGVEATFDAVDVFDLRDGRIMALSTFYDLVAARRAVTP
jgi:ketosteroid isomerase-like protein